MCCFLLAALFAALGALSLMFLYMQHQRPHWAVQALHRGFDLAQVAAVRGASPQLSSWLSTQALAALPAMPAFSALPGLPALPNLPTWPALSGSFGALALRDSR